ncbi:hypothetical protein AKO1_014237 [Acrasis kona]|uniref:Carboxylic ester hydrolase n=1 Tax=Acrasis kona TaxID=1008807 RepID=A0AAW2Z016_9EUKA
MVMLIAVQLWFLLIVGTLALEISTHCGNVSGIYNQDLSSYAFLGIPYAKSTAGKQRWKVPEPLTKSDKSCWSGTYTAGQFGPMCPQISIIGYPIGDENCLSLNIWSANTNSMNLLPVMVFIHGGSLVQESSFTPIHLAHKMVRGNKVVSVSINYRLGPLGFLATESISKARGGTIDSPSGNYGIMDQILALQWVNHNIKQFGGNPDDITVYGQSSGGTSVLILLSSPLFISKNPFSNKVHPLFKKAISMSGSVVIDTPLKVAQSDNHFIVQRTHCKGLPLDKELDCLYELPASELVKASLSDTSLYPYWNNATYNSALPLPEIYQPGIAIVDGYVLKDSVLNSLSDSRNPSSGVPVVVGTMAQELDITTPIDLSAVSHMKLDQYKQFLLNWPSFNEKIVSEIMNLYQIQDYQNKNDKHLLTFASDIKVACGNIVASNSIASVNLSRPVYFYNSPQSFRDPVLFAPYKTKYAFHLLDLVLLFKLYDMFPTTITPDIVKCSDVLFDSFCYFAKHGMMPKDSFWKEFGSIDREYHANIIHGDGSTTTTNFKKSECRFYQSLGWDKQWWKGQ